MAFLDTRCHRTIPDMTEQMCILDVRLCHHAIAGCPTWNVYVFYVDILPLTEKHVL